MAYRMIRLSDSVRAGITSRGELNIEVAETDQDGQPTEDFTEILIPRDAVDELFEFLRRAA